MTIHVNQTAAEDGGMNFSFDFDTKADALAAVTGQEVQVSWNAPANASAMRAALESPDFQALMRDMIFFAAKEHLAPTLAEGETRLVDLRELALAA